jgi:hypothetical protein
MQTIEQQTANMLVEMGRVEMAVALSKMSEKARIDFVKASKVLKAEFDKNAAPVAVKSEKRSKMNREDTKKLFLAELTIRLEAIDNQLAVEVSTEYMK